MAKQPEVILSVEEPERPHIRIFGKLYQYKLPREGTGEERRKSAEYADLWKGLTNIEGVTQEQASQAIEAARDLTRLLVYGIPEDVLLRIDIADLARIIFRWGQYFSTDSPPADSAPPFPPLEG